jgi:charged multivesicular body protein 5
MERLFGTTKPKVPLPTLGAVVEKTDKRAAVIDEKLYDIDGKLRVLQKKMKSLPESSSAYKSTKRRAMELLQRRKLLESQSGQLRSQGFAVEQVAFASENALSTIETVKVMEKSNKDLKKLVKLLNPDKIAELRDDTEDYLDDLGEVQDLMGRTYGGVEADEDELNEELDGLFDADALDILDDAAPAPATRVRVPQPFIPTSEAEPVPQ